MTDVFVYDGYPFRLQHQDHNGVETNLQKKLDEALESLRNRLPDYLLLRTVPDFDRKSRLFHGIENLLTQCATNGNDRSNQSVFDDGIDPHGKIAKAGYKPEDVMWAKPVLRDEQISPYTLSGAPNGISLAILIINGRAYGELSYQVYGQKDVIRRKKALLGIVLFDMSPTESNTLRQDLHLEMTLETIKPIADKINGAGYFVN